MKRLIIFLFILFCILCFSCNSNNGLKGWLVDNQSIQSLEISFDNNIVTIPPTTKKTFDYFSGTESVYISENYHVNYEISYSYNIENGNRRLLKVFDKKQYNYSIKNNTGFIVSFLISNTKYEIQNGQVFNYTSFDSPINFKFFNDNFELFYTQNYQDGIYYILIQ